MSLSTFFSLSPLNPVLYSYDADNPDAPFTYALCEYYGATVLQTGIWSFADQYSNDRIIVSRNAVPLENQDLWTPHPFQTCMSRLYFSGYNVSTENQYLLIFKLEQISLHVFTYAQIFVNSDLVDTVEVRGRDIGNHAILLDCPGDGVLVQVWIRLASPNWSAAIAFRGVDCYLF